MYINDNQISYNFNKEQVLPHGKSYDLHLWNQKAQPNFAFDYHRR